MKYIFFLKNDKTKKYRLISQLLVLINLPVFIILLINNEGTIKNNLWIILAIISTAAYSVFALVERVMKKPMPDFWHRIVLFYCAIALAKANLWWLAVLTLIFIFLDFFALKNQVVKISKENLLIPSFIPKKIEWSALNNVILKDELLTIDFKNNKLFQQLILTSDWDVNEKEFNDFCKAQLNK